MKEYLSHAEICPVCRGTGKYTIYNTYVNSTFTPYSEQTCHGCGGKGWVTVQDGETMFS